VSFSSIIGIDPGLGGALAFLDPAALQRLEVVEMPVLTLARNKRAVDVHALAIMLERPIQHAFLEQASARPGQGTVSMFNFGKTFGAVLGILAARGIPYTLVSPSGWKRYMQVPASKHGARARASQLLPASSSLWLRVKDHGRAESALLALFGARHLAAPAAPALHLVDADEATPRAPKRLKAGQ
jgi:crossover junction endodeoxyribonuclease RuvC